MQPLSGPFKKMPYALSTDDTTNSTIWSILEWILFAHVIAIVVIDTYLSIDHMAVADKSFIEGSNSMIDTRVEYFMIGFGGASLQTALFGWVLIFRRFYVWIMKKTLQPAFVYVLRGWVLTLAIGNFVTEIVYAAHPLDLTDQYTTDRVLGFVRGGLAVIIFFVSFIVYGFGTMLAEF